MANDVALPPGFELDAPQQAAEPAPTPSGQQASRSPQPLRITVTPQPPEDIGALEAAKAGAVQGATFNWGDELAGLGAYGTAREGPEPTDIAGRASGGAAARGAHGLYNLVREKFAGDEAAAAERSAAYDAARDRWRQTVERAQAQQPAAYHSSNIAASLAVPVGAVAAPVRAAGLAGLGARMARGGVTGAAIGGLSGAGEGTDLESRIEQGKTGAMYGGAIGAALPPIAEPVLAAIRPAAQAITSRARAMFNPALEAERRVARTVEGAQERAAAQRAAGTIPDTLTRQEMLAAQAQGQPVTVLDTAGRGGKRLARSVRNTPGAEEGTEALEGMVQGRFASQADRTANFISRLTSGRNATNFERLRERASAANRPAYAAAYAAGDRPIWSPELERLTGSPDIEAAIKSAVRSGKSRAVEEGFGGFNPGVTVTPDGRVLFGGGRRGTPTYPNIQFWDYVQRDLNDMAEKVAGREPDKFRYLNSLHQQLNTELDRLVPEYSQARIGAWRHFQAADAYDAGMKYVNNTAAGRKAEEMARQIENMSAADRVLFMHGFATKLIEDVRNTADNVNVVNRIYAKPAARERIIEALGKNRASQIEAFLRVESVMNQAKEAVKGGSNTAEQLAALGGAGLYSAVTGNLNWGNLLAGYAAVRGKRLAGRANARVADEVGRLLSSQDPDAYRHGIELLARSDVLMDRLRRFMTSAAVKLVPQETRLLTDQRAEKQAAQPSQ